MKLADSERLPKDADGPVFAEPWEAQAFAMAVRRRLWPVILRQA